MKAYVRGREEGEAVWMFDSLDTIKADAERTGGGFSVVGFLDFEGSSVPLHVNDRWDTGFYILAGEYSFVIANETVAASPGARVYVPRRIPHAWRCDSTEGRLLNVTAPGGFEGFYREAGESVPGSNTIARPQRTGCRSPVEHRGTARHQHRRATARRVDRGEATPVALPVSPLLPIREQDSVQRVCVRRGAATRLPPSKSEQRRCVVFAGIKFGRWSSSARTLYRRAVGQMRTVTRSRLTRLRSNDLPL